MTVLTAAEWNSFLAKYPDSHILQSSEWGKLKSGFSWEPAWIRYKDTGAQVLFRKLPMGFHIAYIPKGPIGEDWSGLWEEIDRLCESRKTVFLKVEPDEWDDKVAGLKTQFPGFIENKTCIQPRRTIMINLTSSEEQILSRMKQKTRYNIHLAEKKEIKIVPSEDIDSFYQLITTTGERDQFGVHKKDYYGQALQLFGKDDKCKMLLATFQEQPIAGIMVFRQGKRAWYFYGASSEKERNRMPTYLLQWEAMRWAKRVGCEQYDFWGVPDEPEDILEEQFETRTDGLWKVYRFKRGFGGDLKRSAGAWDKVYQPIMYRFYKWWTQRRGSPA
jgi:lipid II:glycine glycyltransferase (peptidoglycan interpeptide bridge formation enzyme)